MKLIKLEPMHTTTQESETYYAMCTPDGHIHTKKLKDIIVATEEQPRIVVFEDNSFTVGNQPDVYKKIGENWYHQFTFVSIEEVQIKKTPDLKVLDGDKDGGIMEWLKQPLTTLGLQSLNMATKKKEE